VSTQNVGAGQGQQQNSRLSKFLAFVRHVLALPLTKTLARVGETLGKCTIFFAIIVWLWEIPDRAQQRHSAAWTLLAQSRGQPGNGGRADAIKALARDDVSLSGVDLNKAVLGGVEFDDGDFRNTDFSNVIFNDVQFACGWTTRLFKNFCTNLRAAKFIGASLTDVKFVRTNIDDTNFSSATLERVSFYAGAKGGVLFDNAKGRDIKGGRTDGLKFNGAKLRGGSFTDLNLVFADFSHAEITLA
jgi:Pentapeptide repeats (8 copies)